MIIHLTKRNLINNIDFNIKQTKKKVQIIIFLKINIDSLLICKMLIRLFNSKFISCELLIMSHQSEINQFLKKYDIQNQYFLFFFINFGGNIDLINFYYKNSYFLQKIFIIDYCKWFYKDNLTSSSIIIIIDQLYIDSKYSEFLTDFVFKKRKKRLNFLPNDIFNIITESDFYLFNNIWLEIIHISSMYFLSIIDKNKYNNFIFYIGKKFEFYYKNKKNLKQNKKLEINIIKKSRDLSIFLLNHSSLLNALINTPSFSLKFRLWKYSGILKLSQFFIKLGVSFREINNPWIILDYKLKKKLKRNITYYAKSFGVSLIKTCSFEKFFYSIKKKNFSELYKISSIDLLFAIKSIFFIYDYKKIIINKNYNNWKIYNCFLNFKIIKHAIKKAIQSQDFVNRISKIIISKKIYLNEIFFRYSFLKNSENMNINYDTLKNLAFYLMLAFYQKFNKKKAFFLIIRIGNKSIITGAFFKNNHCKILKERLKHNSTLSVKLIDFQISKTLTFVLNTNNEIDLFKYIINFLKLT
jgi:hypothetical protein